MKIKNVFIALTTLASTSFAQLAPDFQYGCGNQQNPEALRLYAHWDGAIQQTGTDTVGFTLVRQSYETYPSVSVYPSTTFLFYSLEGSYTGVPFGGDQLCISRNQSSPVLWIRNELLYDNPVYLASFAQGSLASTHYFQAWNRAENGGFELSNMVSATR